MTAVIRTISRLFNKPPAPPASAVGPVTAAIRTMRAAEWADRANALRLELEAASPDDGAAAHLSALRDLITASAALGAAR